MTEDLALAAAQQLLTDDQHVHLVADGSATCLGNHCIAPGRLLAGLLPDDTTGA